MFSTILLPLDGSETSAQALPLALEMAKRFGAGVQLLQVVDSGAASLALGANAASGALADPATITEEVESQVAVATAYLSAVAEQFAQEGVTAEYAVEDGPTGDDIVNAAARAKAELIVMCSHGRTGLGRLLRGSVADHVVKNSPVPVLLVRAREG